MTQNVTLMKSKQPAILSDEHAASSYGQPVLLWHGGTYGPADQIPSAYISESEIGPLHEQGESGFIYSLQAAPAADQDRVRVWNERVRAADEVIALW